MGHREGQARVEVRPGVWLWLDEAERKGLAGTASPVAREPSEATTVTPPETTSQPSPRKRRAG
jgi:hypothetical protein